MKKKIISAFLVLALMLAMTIPVFAGSYSSYGYYEGSYYEIVDNCYSDRFSSSTFCMDQMVHSNVTAYKLNPPDPDHEYENYYGTATMSAYTLTRYPGFVISRVYCYHLVDNSVVRTQSVTP